jgi:hypothetical protein
LIFDTRSPGIEIPDWSYQTRLRGLEAELSIDESTKVDFVTPAGYFNARVVGLQDQKST